MTSYLTLFIFPLVQSYEPKIVFDIYKAGFFVKKIGTIDNGSIGLGISYEDQDFQTCIGNLMKITNKYFNHGCVFSNTEQQYFSNTNISFKRDAPDKRELARASDEQLKTVESSADAIDQVISDFNRIIGKK